MAQKIILLPSGAFFVKRLEVAVGLSDGDLAGVGFSAVAADAPVPPERLRCGVLRAEDGLATSFGALETSAFGETRAEDLISARIAMPYFCALLLSGLRDGRYFFTYGGGISAVKLESAAATEFAAIENVADFDAAKAELSDFLAADYSDAKTLRLESARIDNNKNVVFIATDISDGKNPKEIQWSAPLSKLAGCDVRGAAFLTAVARERKKKLMGAIAMAAIPSAFVFLIIFQILVFYKSGKVSALDERLQTLEPAAKAVEKRSEKIAEFSAMVKSRMLPLELLAKINAARADSVAITSFSVYPPNSFDMAGTSTNLANINEFADKLKKLPFIAKLQIKSDSSKNESKFTINCTLKK